MEINENMELDIENKYIKNKKDTVFTIEEAIYIVEREEYCDEVEDIAIDQLIKYIKEESIPRAVVEEKIEKLKILAEKSDCENLIACELDIRKNQLYLLENLLIKGE